MVQDVKEIAGSVKNSVNHLREELRPDEKPTQMPGEIPEQDEKDLSEGSDKELDAGLGVSFFLFLLLSCVQFQGLYTRS